MRAGSFARGFAALACLFVVSLAPRSAPAAEGGEESLRTLYRIALSAEMCGFPIAARQADALGKAMNRALSETGLEGDAADQVYRDVDAALEAEGWDKVCQENGAWARSYRALLAANTR